MLMVYVSSSYIFLIFISCVFVCAVSDDQLSMWDSFPSPYIPKCSYFLSFAKLFSLFFSGSPPLSKSVSPFSQKFSSFCNSISPCPNVSLNFRLLFFLAFYSIGLFTKAKNALSLSTFLTDLLGNCFVNWWSFMTNVFPNLFQFAKYFCKNLIVSLTILFSVGRWNKIERYFYKQEIVSS